MCVCSQFFITHALLAGFEPVGEEGCSGSRFTRQVGNEQPSPKLKSKQEKTRTSLNNYQVINQLVLGDVMNINKDSRLC